jgi:hypothetical protein
MFKQQKEIPQNLKNIQTPPTLNPFRKGGGIWGHKKKMPMWTP